MNTSTGSVVFNEILKFVHFSSKNKPIKLMKRNFIQVPSYLDYLVERGDDGRRRADRGTANLSGRPKGYFFRESHIHWPMVVLRDFRNAHPDVDLHCVNVASPVFCRRTLKGCAKMTHRPACGGRRRVPSRCRTQASFAKTAAVGAQHSPGFYVFESI